GAVALGYLHTGVDISGATRVTVPGSAPVDSTGGLLALPTNIGHHSIERFAVMPTVAARLGYPVTDNVRAVVGYNFLYLGNVTRAGDVIDTTVNPTQLPPGTLVGPARPAFIEGKSDYWLHGISGGLEFRY